MGWSKRRGRSRVVAWENDHEGLYLENLLYARVFPRFARLDEGTKLYAAFYEGSWYDRSDRPAWRAYYREDD